MDKRIIQPSENSGDSSDSNTEWCVLLYSIGALSGLLCAFHPSLTALQTTNCLVLSWLLALGALVVSLFSEQTGEDSDEDAFSDY